MRQRQSNQVSRARCDQTAMPARKPGRGAGARIANPGAIAASAPAPAQRPSRANGPKLTLDDARAIRARRTQSETLQSLADTFGVTVGTIDHICQGRTFKSLGGPVRVPKNLPKGRRGVRHSSCGQCSAPIAVAFDATRNTCQGCADIICPPIYDRERGDTPEQLPPNLRRYLQG
jgi:hypothetical protein